MSHTDEAWGGLVGTASAPRREAAGCAALARRGVRRPCVVNLDTLTTVPKQLLAERLAVLSPGRVRAIDAAIAFALGLEV